MCASRFFVMLVVGCVGCAETSELERLPSVLPQAQAQIGGGSGGGAEYETVTLTLPKGNEEAGRQAFVDLRCTACHQATGETSLPAPVSGSPGPVLGASLAQRPPGSLATAIVAPSHSMSIETSPETRANVEGVLSPMGDYSESMSVRQLLDLIAYLEARP